MTDKNDDYTIYDYVSHHFDITIGETWTCLTCHTKKLKVLNDDSFIFPLEVIAQKRKKLDQLVMIKRLIWARAVLP